MASALFSARYSAMIDIMIAARKSASLTQVEVAARLGRAQSYISKIERRERRVDPVEFYDWAVAVGVPPAKLFESFAQRLETI